ncbi:SDR family NAD(P)-dependent oxidoreductase [Amycolatopsis mongoliensis]|uniref:SDR family NAD(P)-dependent oxidoreductase n=1 Tax=Amycolatopsis mongoliensis TaxID=715475 RepID=A0A9Y2JYR0_9PSEU|nr:SDR family NAD(P)-dependent oxidoreductase [Amycolatopsis sp. 4-36]WIY06081.1 SDR family NAD(P)-dependent oxidoreductase [Amycolatopsis sp. 4-36]
MKTLLMTGASRGLGRAAAEKILRERPGVHLVVTARGGALAGELARSTGNPNVTALACDLASMTSIRAAAAELAGLPPLDGFVGNAGLQMTSRAHATEDGFEPTFAVNVLANYLLLRLLWARFAAPARIVLVGSDTHFGDFRHTLGMVPAPRWEPTAELARPRPDARTATDGRRAYSTSKLALIHLVHALARRLPDGVDVYTFNPGYVPGTGLVRDAGPVVRFASRTLMPALTATPLAMSATAAGGLLADAVLGPRPAGSGAYIDRRKVTPSSPASYDHDREEDLWRDLAGLCALDPVERL